MSIYCVYLTTYRGSKLPPFYIGSSSVEKVKNGYHGSVASKQFKDTWKDELKSDPSLFTTKIITAHLDRKDATLKERQLQKKLNVVKNSLYINQSFAAYDSFTDRDQRGKNNPMYGSSRCGNENPFFGQKHTDLTRAKMRGRKCTEENKQLYRKLKTGVPQSEETKLKQSIAKKGKASNNKSVLNSISKQKFICIIDTKKEYTYLHACRLFPGIKHLFWSKKLA